MPRTLTTIAKEWDTYRTKVIPRGAPPIQVMESRRAFYAGAEAFFRAIYGVSDLDVPDDDGAEYIERLYQELQAFGKDIGDGRA